MRLTAYLDDELTAPERLEFEQQLATDPKLATEVAELRCLQDLTQSLQLAEPSDHEVRRFWESFYNRSEWQLGWGLLLFGGVILGVFGLYELLVSEEVPALVKVGSVAALLGGGILFWNTLRLKLRAHRFDRYRGVIR
jgi:hypothetical protein